MAQFEIAHGVRELYFKKLVPVISGYLDYLHPTAHHDLDRPQ
jgi:hypothetical protein